MSSKRELYLSNCLGIIGYSDEDIALDFGKFSMKVYGYDLTMVSYINGEMYIEGDILRIEFESAPVESNVNVA